MCISPVGEGANLSMVMTPIVGRTYDGIIGFFTENLIIYFNIL
jgi:hypothetical protein